MDYLGHQIKPARFDISTQAARAIRGLRCHRRVIELMWFVCLTNLFRWSVLSSACMKALLNNELCNDQFLHFGRLNQTEIDALKTGP